MSHLRITLLVAGVVVVIGIYAFNLWQERQLRRRAERFFAREHDDVLLQSATTTRLEPRIHADAAAATQRAAPPAPDTPPRVVVHNAGANAGIATSTGKKEPVLFAAAGGAIAIDAGIDDVVEIALEAPADGLELYAALRALAARWHKPALAEGIESGGDAWQPLRAGRAQTPTPAFRRLRYAVQLVNRDGSITLEQLQAFRDAAQRWAAQHGGRLRAVDVAQAQQAAAALDRLCGEVDIALGLNIVSDGAPFQGAAIRDAARNAGLQLESDGKFRLRDADGMECFALENHEPALFVADELDRLVTPGITLVLDVPRVADSVSTFERMFETAQGLAAALNGALVDDNGIALAATAVARIRQQLQHVAERMRAAGIVAGSPRAQRLFS